MPRLSAIKGKCNSTSQRQPLPGTRKICFQMPEVLIDAMNATRKRRHNFEKVDPKKCRLYIEAVAQYVEACDPVTGMPPKRKPLRRANSAEFEALKKTIDGLFIFQTKHAAS